MVSLSGAFLDIAVLAVAGYTWTVAAIREYLTENLKKIFDRYNYRVFIRGMQLKEKTCSNITMRNTRDLNNHRIKIIKLVFRVKVLK
ncbi:MAG: hypothetical protein ACTSQY_04165 [Candidatus Odinarchaeia archaeon]